MKKVEDSESIRRAYFIEKMSIRAIHRLLGYDRDTIRKAITHPAPQPYKLEKPRAAPMLRPYKQKIEELLAESGLQEDDLSTQANLATIVAAEILAALSPIIIGQHLHISTAWK